MKQGKIILGVDFDGTIVENKFPGIGKMKPDADRVLKALSKSGFKIVIHTCRANPELGEDKSKKYIEDMEKWLKDNEIPYDDIWKGVGKPLVHLFVDDNALPFLGWATTLEGILKMMELIKNSKGKLIIPPSEGGKNV